MLRKRFSVCLVGVAAALALAACGPGSAPGAKADADNFPSGPITIVVKSSAGSGTDNMARQAAKFLQSDLDEPVAVLNLTAGDGVAAVQKVLSSPKDGTVVGADTYSLVVKLAGDLSSRYSADDFDFLAQVQSGPYMLVVPGDSDVKDLDDFKAAVGNNAKFSVAGYGAKSGDQLFNDELSEAMGVNPQYIPFEGGSEVITAALGHNVDAAVTTVNNAISYVQSGKLRALGIASEQPLPELPDVPTFTSEGLSQIKSIDNYRFFYTAEGTSPGIVKKWDEALLRLSKDESWQKYLKSDGLVNTYIAGDEFAEVVHSDIDSIKEKLNSTS